MVVRSVERNTFDILMLLWPWKMLKLSVGPSVGTDCFCNVLDWTGLDWTGLDWTGLDWTGLDWTGLDWTGPL